MSKARTVEEVLIAAKWIVENVGWCKGNFAQDKYGESTPMGGGNAVKFCAIGAIEVVDDAYDALSHGAIDAFCDVLPDRYESIMHFNDAETTRKSDVLKMFDKAIKACKTT